MRISRKILKTQYTDEFGGYSKTWFSDGLKEMRNNKNNIDELEEENQGDFGMDYLARSLGLDIEALAIKLATEDDDSNIKPITETIPHQQLQQMVDEIPSLAETPCGPMRPDEVRKGVLVKKGAQ